MQGFFPQFFTVQLGGLLAQGVPAVSAAIVGLWLEEAPYVPVELISASGLVQRAAVRAD